MTDHDAPDLEPDDAAPGADRVTIEPLGRALGERYLTYALSTIMNRALPDARDGLKPVHRRTLYAMRALKLDPGSGFKKSARIVGDVMGKFHPHGDGAIYEALVRLAQDFSSRYPLIDGQGNFGNIDGDNPAAMRYTESRLTPVAALLLDGLDEDSVPFKPSYDGLDEEPVVLPAAFPNLLANGASGIAVGMATSIPPHNVGEIADALTLLIDQPDASLIAVMERLPAPDFPTGGVLVEPKESIREAYATGRGGFRLRAAWTKEDLGRGLWRIVVTEIPYQVQKSKLIERLADLVNTKKVPILGDIVDESAEDVRIVIEPRAKTVDPTLLMETLFKLSELETRFPLNMNVLKDGRTPQVLSLIECLKVYLDHRRDVLQRRTRHRLGKIEHRLEIVGGYLIAYLNLDRVIAIIREEDAPKPALMDAFRLSDAQAEAILNMRLRSLRKLEEMELRHEQDALTREQADLQALLADEAAQWRNIRGEVATLKQKFGPTTPGGARRTGFGEATPIADTPLEATVLREPITVICSAKGWIRAQKGHAPLDGEVKYKDGDAQGFVLHAETTDRLLLLASDGRVFTLACDKLPGGRGMGEPLRLMIDLNESEDLVALVRAQPGARRIFASSDGRGFIAREDEVMAQTRAGKQVLTLDAGARAAATARVEGDLVAVIGENRKMLVFPAAELPEMARGKGVILQRYKEGGLADVTTCDGAVGLTWRDPAGRTRTEADLSPWRQKRAAQGVAAPRGFPKDGRFGGA